MTFDSTRRWMAITILAVVATMSLSAGAEQNRQGPEALFERARLMEENGKTLSEAIALYRQVAAQAASNRPLAAQALLRAAECYQKLGDVQARTIYEQLVRDYPDQKDTVALAQARLRVQPASASDIQTRWQGPEVDTQGTISTDGRYLSYVEHATCDLAIRDLVAGTSRRLTAALPDCAEMAQYSAISRDGKKVAYAWYSDKAGRYELRILPIDATPRTTPRVTANNPDLKDIYPYDWSPDGRWIAVRLSHIDRTAQIGLVDSRDLSIKVLKSVDWGGSTKILFSPDGQYLAYDLPVGDPSRQRDIFVMDIDRLTEVAAVAHSANDVVMGWDPDGRALLFTSNRAGPLSLWTVPMAAGKPSGPPTILRPDIGPVTDTLGVTRSGELVLGVWKAGANIYTSTFDPATGRLLQQPTPLVDGYLQSNRDAVWSPDGKTIAYLSARPNEPKSLVTQSLDSGRTHVTQPLLSWFLTPTWAPDGSITVSGADLKGRRAIQRIDMTTGQPTSIVTSPSGSCDQWPSWSSDGRVFVYLMQCEESGIIVRDTATGGEREIARAPVFGLGRPAVSPDGRRVAYVRSDPATKSATLEVIPTEGGTPRQVLRVVRPLGLGGRLAWTPDGRRVAVARSNGSKGSMLLVPLDGGATVEIEAPVGASFLTLHPDGQRLAFGLGKGESEVRVVDLKRPAAARR